MPSAVVTTRFDQSVVDLSGVGSGPLVMGSDNEPVRATYGATITGLTPAANATDIVTLIGAAGKIIRLKQIIISGTATAASNIFLYLNRRSALNTGGTSTTPTIVPHDSADNAPSAVVRSYTANPGALGTLVGNLHGGRLNLAPAANGSIDRLVWQFAWMSDKAPVLRAATEQFGINNNSVAIPAGGALDIDLLWTEE